VPLWRPLREARPRKAEAAVSLDGDGCENAGTKPRMVTNVTTKEKALERVRAACAPAAAHTAPAGPEMLNESDVTAAGPEVHLLVPAF
jgi:hypothetical protein